jgi:hypothetical protein
MTTTFGDFAPEILTLLVGGLLGSLGSTFLARHPRARARLARTPGWSFAVALLAVGAAAGAVAFVQVRAVLAEGTPGLETVTPPQLLLFGFLIGVPLSFPGLLFTWSDVRARERARLKKRDFVPTKDDRRAWAADLARQIEEVSPTPRSVSASIGGEGGRVLVLSGDIGADEAERLTAALRADLAELGFKRVEGGKGTKEWWTRV